MKNFLYMERGRRSDGADLVSRESDSFPFVLYSFPAVQETGEVGAAPHERRSVRGGEAQAIRERTSLLAVLSGFPLGARTTDLAGTTRPFAILPLAPSACMSLSLCL